MAHDVFLSYASKDKPAAEAACAVLERGGIRVWMAPRDILPGIGWGASIVEAINDARVMVLVFSGHANASPQIEREVERAINKGLPVIPLRIEDIVPSGALEYFINASHWLDAFTMPLEPHLDRLTEVVRRVIDMKYGKVEAARRDEEARRQQEQEEAARRAAEAEEQRKAGQALREREEAEHAEAEPKALASRQAGEPRPLEQAEAVHLVASTGTGETASSGAPKARWIPLGAAAGAILLVAAGAWFWFDPKGDTPPTDTQHADFDVAMQAGTIAALDGFLTEYPSGPLANTARRERDKLKVTPVTPAAPPAAVNNPSIRVGEMVAAVTSNAPPAAPGPCGGVGLVSLLLRSPAPLSRQEECALKPGNAFKECAKCPKMEVVPAGSFTMGSPESEEGREADEGPQHEVTLAKPFAVGKFAVTFDEWDACAEGGGCGGYRPKDEGWGRGRMPVINVSWDDAKAYVEWLSKTTGKTYRLLSEAEWEYAARGGTKTPFWWGSSISTEQANYNGDYTYNGGKKGEYRQKTVPVDSFAANPFGLYNVHGNVWQWVEDCWNGNYGGAPENGSAWTTGDCNVRVRRGGSWGNIPRFLRAAIRGGGSADFRGDILGFRLARTLTP